MPELKPCPFCGGEAQIIEQWIQDPLGRARVDCSVCRAGFDQLEKGQLIKLWNSHPSPWIKIEFLDDLPTETDLLFHNGIDTFQSWVNVCMDTGANYIVDDEEATHWMPLPVAPEGVL